MFFGIKKPLDKSLQAATETMVLWLEYKLEYKYGLSRREVSQVVGPAIQYRIPKTAGSIREVVAMIPKGVVAQLKAIR